MHHHQLLFSIITCSLDSGKYIDVLIRSVEDQIYTNYEHIFIDGFSKDNTLQNIKKDILNRLSYFKLQPKVLEML